MLIEKSNSLSKIVKASELELKLAKKALTYFDENKKKNYERLQIALARTFSIRKKAWIVGQLKQYENYNVCLLNNDNTFPTGLVFKIKELYELAKNDSRYNTKLFELKIINKQIKPEAYNIFRWNNTPPKMRYYQEECLSIAEKENRGTFEVCVGGGKTLIAANIIKSTGVNTLFIVPSSALAQQTYEVFSSYFGKSKVQQLTTKIVKDNKKLGPILISTVQTLGSLTKQNLVHKVMNHVHSMMIDEAHHSASSTYMNLLPYMDHIYYRYNFSGTYIRNDAKIMELWGVCDKKLYKYSSAQATKDGYLTPVEFKIKTIRGEYHSVYNTEYSKNYSSKVFLDEIVNQVKSIPSDKQILILVDRKELVGQQIHDFLKVAKIESTYVTGDNNKKELSKAMEDFNNKKTRILIASTVLGEGADIRSTDYLIMARGGKSEIAITQAVGRAVRLYPDKKTATVIDFDWSGPKWLGKHTKLRMETYVKEFDAKITKI